MRTVVTVPIGDGGAMELLAVDRRELEPETLQALDVAARQLKIVAQADRAGRPSALGVDCEQRLGLSS